MIASPAFKITPSLQACTMSPNELQRSNETALKSMQTHNLLYSLGQDSLMRVCLF